MFVITAAVAPALIPVPQASAQILGPLLSGGAFEMGGSYKLTHRSYELSGGQNVAEQEKDYWDGSIFIRYGTNGWVTLSGEAMLGDVRTIEESSGDHRYYVFGMGIQTRVYRWRRYAVAAGIHYIDKLTFSRNRESCDFRFGSLTGVIQVEKTIPVTGHRLTIWGGPSYEYGFEDRLLSDRCGETEWRSLQNLGVTLGVDMVFYSHLRADTHVVYAKYVQPRFTLSWLF